MEKSHFWGDWWFFMWFLVILLVGTGEPPPYCNKNTLGKIESKFGIGRPPPPQLGQKTKFFQWFYLKAPLTGQCGKWSDILCTIGKLYKRGGVSDRCEPTASLKNSNSQALLPQSWRLKEDLPHFSSQPCLPPSVLSTCKLREGGNTWNCRHWNGKPPLWRNIDLRRPGKESKVF